MQINRVVRNKNKTMHMEGNTIDWGQSKFEYGGDDMP
jgi:hypothetical protein